MLFATKQAEQTDTASQFIFDVTVSDFENRVLRASFEKPVIVDFWAPWCGPCKQLGPVLESEVDKAGGTILMAKVNLDENPELAQALRIQSVPTVFAFFQGQPVDAFTGAQQESQIKAFVDNLVQLAKQAQPDALDIPEALQQAAQALADKDLVGAQSLYAQIIGEDQENVQAYAGLVRTYIAADKKDKAKALIEQAPESVSKSPVFNEAKTALELADTKPDTPVHELAQKVEDNPEDLHTRFDLALALFAEDRRIEAAEELLEIIRHNREWEEEKARVQLLKFFDAWGATDPATLKARRKLSGILFS